LHPFMASITLQPMIRIMFVALLGAACLPAADDLAKPDKMTIHTWVREDIFAGWMAYDGARLENGLRKVERYLQDRPNDANALAWKYLALTYRMREARKKGDDEAYRRHLAEAKDVHKQALGKETKDAGPYIIIGGSLVFGALFVPDQDKEWMYRDGRELLRKVPVLQAQYFDTLPAHMRGELWSLLAFASDRLGDKQERDKYITEMMTKLAGTPYEGRAKRWQNQASLTSEVDNMCITCHEQGRLAAVQAKLNASK
jgi:hypothetical protein